MTAILWGGEVAETEICPFSKALKERGREREGGLSFCLPCRLPLELPGGGW